MDCKRANELMVELLYEEIESADKKALNSHVKRCSKCRKELASLKKTRSLVQGLRDLEPPDHLDGAIMREAEAASGGGAAEPAVLQVFIFRDGDFVGTDMFTENEVAIGRDPDVADLVLESSQVSRKHAVLRQDGKRVTIHDAGSTNGIFIGDKKIDGVEVTRLDEVLLGDYSIKIKLVVKSKPQAAFSDEATRIAPSAREEVEESTERPTAIDDKPPPKVAPAAARGLSAEWDDVSSSVDVPRAPLLEDGEEAMPGHTAVAYRSGDRRIDEISRDAPRDSLAGDGDLPVFGEGPVLDDDDDDDEDANYVPPYSLVSQLLQEDAIVTKERAFGKPNLEVLTLQGDSVADVRLLRPGDSFWVGPALSFLRRRRARDLPPRVRLLKYTRGGSVRVEMRNDVKGTIKRGKQRAKLDQEPNLQRSKRRDTKIMGMRKGEVLDIVDGGNRYHIRFVHPPPPSRDPRGLVERVSPDRNLLRSFGGSAGAHIFGLVLVYVLVPPEIVHSTLRKNDEFVEVVMDAAPEVEEPKPEEEKPDEEEPQKAEDEKAPPKQNKSKRRSRAGGTTKAPAGVLGLLSKKGSSKAPGPAAAVAAVSNLTAARVPGAASGYKVSGLIGKLPSNSLSVGGGGGGLMTKGGAALLRGGGGGGGLARGKSRKVGGLVQKNPKAMRSVGQGHLDRDEIQKVINKHIGQIQRCYERELLKTPGLSGKVQVEWTISTSGKVRSARQTYTSIRSTNVSNCILQAIRGWMFPRPRGGEVIVNYPFIFKSIGF